jgi:outer membrane protein
VSTELYAGLRKRHQLERSRLDLRNTILGIEKLRNDITINVTAAFVKILFAEENLKIANGKHQTLLLQKEKIQRFVNANAKTEGDLMQIDAQIAQAQNDIINANATFEKTRLALCQLLEIKDHRNFRVTPLNEALVETLLLPHSIASIRNLAAANLPQARAARLGIDIAGQNVELARAALYPTLSLAANYTSNYANNLQRMRVDANGQPITDANGTPAYMKYPLGDQWRNNSTVFYSLSLSIPIFNSFRTKNNIKLSRFAMQRAEYEALQVEKQITKEVEEAYIDAKSAFDRYSNAKVGVESSRESLRHIERKLDAGMSTQTDYFIALDNMTEAESKLSQAKYEMIFRSKILDFYTYPSPESQISLRIE